MALDCSLDLHRGRPLYLEDGETIYGYFCYVCEKETEEPIEIGRDTLSRPIRYAKAKPEEEI